LNGVDFFYPFTNSDRLFQNENGSREFRMPFLGRKEMSNLKLMMFLGGKSWTRSSDLMALVVKMSEERNQLIVLEVTLKSWFTAPDENHPDYLNNPVSWRVMYRVEIPRCDNIAANCVRGKEFLISMWNSTELIAVQFEYHPSIRDQIQHTPTVHRLDNMLLITSVSVSTSNCILVSKSDGYIGFWKIAEPIAMVAVPDMISTKVMWLNTDALILLIGTCGSLFICKISNNNVIMLGKYPSMTKLLSTTWCLEPLIVPVTGESLLEIWVVCGYTEENSGLMKMFAVRMISNGALSLPSLTDIADTGILTLKGKSIRGGFLCSLGKTTQVCAGMIRNICENQEGLGVLVLDEKGVGCYCFDSLSSTLDFTSAPIPLKSPSKIASRKEKDHVILFKKPPIVSRNPYRSKLVAEVEELHGRVSVMELDLIHLRTEFTEFTSEISTMMSALLEKFKNKAPTTF